MKSALTALQTRKTYLGCLLLGLLGLLFSFRETTSWLGWLTPELFATLAAIITALTGVAMKAGQNRTERQLGLTKALAESFAAEASAAHMAASVALKETARISGELQAKPKENPLYPPSKAKKGKKRR